MIDRRRNGDFSHLNPSAGKSTGILPIMGFVIVLAIALDALCHIFAG